MAFCERFLRIETLDYSESAWCRLEPLLSYVFQFVDYHTIIHLDFKSSTINFHHGKEIQALILDPLNRRSTHDQADLTRIQPVVDLAKEITIKKNETSSVVAQNKNLCQEINIRPSFIPMNSSDHRNSSC